ncbi:MAG: hypothetical protein J0H74_06675 [Chitinophagaceae bacterium]|nr:hypothetical protein [Chitinophagaceae bacterium]
MIKLTPRCLAAIALLSFFSISCKKDIHQASVIQTSTGTRDGLPTYFFHWESANLMPVPSGSSQTIWVPWGNLATKAFSPDIMYDMQPADGWQLVYNEFDPTLPALPNNPCFVLYNKFSGILRIYVYVTTNGFVPSDYLTTGLSLNPNTISSTMLNFIGQDFIDVNTHRTVFTKIEPYQMATGAWYAAQYEIAYDPNIATSSYTQVGLNWSLKWTYVTQISLGGDIQGTIKGTISTPASGFDLSGLASNAATGALEASGLSIFQNNAGNDPAHPGTGNHLGLPANVFESMQSGLSSGLSGVVKNIFSGIFGSGGSTQNVDLTLNAKITLTGSATQSGALIPDPGLTVGLPGTTNSQSVQGLNPYYNSPMGVFNISATPKLIVTDQLATTGVSIGYGATSRADKHTYSIDHSSFQVLYNPAVINTAADGAHIENYKEELVMFSPSGIWLQGSGYATDGYTEPGGPDDITDGTVEQVGSNSVALNSTYSTRYIIVPPLPSFTSYKVLHQTMGIRISFNVVSNANSAKKWLMAKTFYADQVFP